MNETNHVEDFKRVVAGMRKSVQERRFRFDSWGRGATKIQGKKIIPPPKKIIGEFGPLFFRFVKFCKQISSFRTNI